MQSPAENQRLIELDTEQPIWDRFFWVAPLVLVGTLEPDGNHDLAPKHMAMPMGWENYFGFVCTPRHHTYSNIKRDGVFTVSFPRPEQLVLTSLAASPRFSQDEKPAVKALPVFPSTRVDGVLLSGAYLFLECELDRFVDDFGVNSLIVGRVVAARVAEDAARDDEVDDQARIHEAPLLAYLHPGRFASVSDSLSFPFPAGMAK
ncbi:MAG: flavin reductase family protein [Xanthomonadales bacterium]|jgi:flavin reductase (DIM6/NTAB) family NADH-FMN oxidoreductase RutF|nr:flavin reductase family protein [Xanthomonadales bacterium]MDH3924625.1 flavin reductase family protein [Xanthomonadales bacterium]MDH3999742.1 flavin reductase family protein [Xanthomonadales bacterium]